MFINKTNVFYYYSQKRASHFENKFVQVGLFTIQHATLDFVPEYVSREDESPEGSFEIRNSKLHFEIQNSTSKFKTWLRNSKLHFKIQNSTSKFKIPLRNSKLDFEIQNSTSKFKTWLLNSKLYLEIQNSVDQWKIVLWNEKTVLANQNDFLIQGRYINQGSCGGNGKYRSYPTNENYASLFLSVSTCSLWIVRVIIILQ
jgi:hypothetical protein